MKKRTSYILLLAFIVNIILPFTGQYIVKAHGAASRLIIVSPGNKNTISEGEKLELKAIIFDNDNNRLSSENIIWTSRDENILTVSEEGLVTGKTQGNASITAQIESNTSISMNYDITIKSKEKKDTKTIAYQVLLKLSKYYEDGPSYDYLPAMAVRSIGEEFNIDYNNLKRLMLHPDKASVGIEALNGLYCAENIMTIIAAGQDPTHYNFKGEVVNFIDILVKAQNDDGQFVIKENFDTNYIKGQCYSIMALDMAQGEYNEEAAVKALMKLGKNPKNFPNISCGEVGLKALMVTALSNHRNIEGVPQFIDSYLEEIKQEQNDRGGFDGGQNKLNSTVTTGMVIQALIANEIDPLSWTNSGRTVLDAILEHQLADGTFYDADGESNRDYRANDQIYAAFSDLYNRSSMFKTIRFDKDAVKRISVKRIGDNNLTKGEIAELKFSVTNEYTYDKEVTLVTVIYDKNTGKMIDYIYIDKEIKSNKAEILGAKMNVPADGDYIVKVYAWDNFQNMKLLCDPIIVETI